jgi:Raf kinase inhibitor-like YbhB/YbcL family protein
MKKLWVLIIIIIVIISAVIFYWYKNQPQPSSVSGVENKIINQTPMKIQSPAFQNNQSIPSKYTCDGGDVNPPLEFLEVPKEAKTLALIVDDPDAPKGDWVHWLVWNINPVINQIAESSVPEEAVEGVTDFGRACWGGPCPPSGNPHHYHFALYALDGKLNLPSYSVKKDLLQAMNGHIIGQAELVGVYQRNK